MDERKAPHDKRFEYIDPLPPVLSNVRSISPPNFKKGKKRDDVFPPNRKNMPTYDFNIDAVMPSLTVGSKSFAFISSS